MTPTLQETPETTRRAGQKMRLLAASASLLALGAFASPASAAAKTHAKTVAFSAHYSGTVALLIDNGSATISSVKGTGTGTPSLVGASAISGSGSAGASALCDPFGGTGTIKGAGGTIKFVVAQSSSQGCSSGQSGPVTVTFKGVAKATGGTGKDKGAAGNLSFSGTLKLADTSGSENGTFTVSLHGRLSVA